MADEAASVANTTTTKKKKKNVFKRLAKGLAIKKKKKHPDDASVMGVSVSDDVSAIIPNGSAVVTTTNNNNDASPPIQIVLLLMDPTTRRFELLQLEFDSDKALVSDVLDQIEQSATETTLRSMNKYGGLCDMEGLEMIAACKLSMFCNSGGGKKCDVVLAMPRGMSGRDTVKLSRPILEDEKVVEMVRENFNDILYLDLKLCFSFILDTQTHTCLFLFSISKKLRPCGINLTAKPKTKTRSGGIPNALPIIGEDETTPKSNRNYAANNHYPSKKAKRKPSYLPTQILGIIIAVAIVFIMQQHVRITRPIQSGLCLLPGEWISPCGLWELLPSSFGRNNNNKLFCDTKTMSKLYMGKDGKLRYYTGVGLDEIWTVGTECSSENDDAAAEQCVTDLDCQGAIFTLEGKKWFVEVNGDRKPLIKEVIEQFT